MVPDENVRTGEAVEAVEAVDAAVRRGCCELRKHDEMAPATAQANTPRNSVRPDGTGMEGARILRASASRPPGGRGGSRGNRPRGALGAI